MASFKLSDFFFCFLIYIKLVYSVIETEKSESRLAEPIKTNSVSRYLSVKGNTATFNSNDTNDVLKFDQGEWLSFYSGESEAKSVNVLYKKDSDKYFCESDGKVYTYTPKNKTLFNKVKSHPGGDAPEEVIFETKELPDMVYELVYDESDPDKLVVITHHINRLIKKFVRNSVGKWEETAITTPVPKSDSPTVRTSPDAKPVTSAQTNLTSVLTKNSGTENNEPAPKKQLPLLDQTKIKIFYQDPKDSKKTIECDASTYSVEVTDGIMITYRLKDGVKCVEVRYDNKVVWRHNPSKPDEYPKFLHFLLTGPIVIEMSKDLFYFSFRRSNDDWESVTMGKFDFGQTEVILKTFDSNFDPVTLETNEFNLTNHRLFLEYRFKSHVKCDSVMIKSHYPWMYNEAIYGQYPSAVYVFANEILALCGGKAFIQRLDINNPDIFYMPQQIIKPTLAGFTFDKKDGYLFYEIDSRVKCVGINYDGKVVWKRDDSNTNSSYPESLFFVAKGNTAFVIFKDFMNVFKLTEEGWKSKFVGNPEPIHLDIAFRLSNHNWAYVASNKVHTYTPKGNFMFTSILKTRNYSGRKKQIWAPKYADAYANKVIFNENNGILTIHQLNGLTREFLKQKDGTWKESVQANIGTDLSQEKVEILTEGQASNSKN